MDYDLKIKQLEEELSKLKEKIEYEKCPLCYGEGIIETPSKENDFVCWTCNGSGKIKRDN